MDAQQIMKGATVTSMWGAITFISSQDVLYGSLLAFCAIIVTGIVAVGGLSKAKADT